MLTQLMRQLCARNDVARTRTLEWVRQLLVASVERVKTQPNKAIIAT